MYLPNYCRVFLFLVILEGTLQENPLIDENFFEGDIIGIDSDTILQSISQSNYDISNEDSAHFAADGRQIGHGAATSDKRILWPDGKVYYKISEEFSPNEIAFIQNAFDDYHRHTCIKLIERTDQTDYIKFVRRGGCKSWIGKIGGEQDLHLDSYCLANKATAKGLAIHEIMHAIGFYHEQSRTDRDEYVEIFLDNLDQITMSGNFMKYGPDTLQNLQTEYDYESIMHYATTDFASPGKETIKPKKPGVRIGQRKGLSQIDIREINLLYKCNIVDPTTVPKVVNKIEICWGTRFMGDTWRFRVDKSEDCVKRCNSNATCEGITFYNNKAYQYDNCFFFTSANSYYAENDPTLQYGSWKKDPRTFQCNRNTYICWGTRFMLDRGSFRVDNWNDCIQRCNQNSVCEAITFYDDKAYTNENCFLFNAATNYKIEYDPDLRYGSWKKNQNSFQCQKHSEFRWGTRYMRHYSKCSVNGPNDCIKRCKLDNSCDAISFRSNTSNENCYFFNAVASWYDSTLDPTNKWGSWKKNEISPVLKISRTPIQWGKRLKIDYNHCNVRNAPHCKLLCEQDSRCHAMSFDMSRESARNINCYFFNSGDHFTSEDAEKHWGTWRKPTAPV